MITDLFFGLTESILADPMVIIVALAVIFIFIKLSGGRGGK